MIPYYPELENILNEMDFHHIDDILDVLFSFKNCMYAIRCTVDTLFEEDLFELRQRLSYDILHNGFLFSLEENSDLINIVYLNMDKDDFLKILKMRAFI